MSFFPVADSRRLRNTLLQNVTSAPSPTVIRKRARAHLFNHTFPRSSVAPAYNRFCNFRLQCLKSTFYVLTFTNLSCSWNCYQTVFYYPSFGSVTFWKLPYFKNGFFCKLVNTLGTVKMLHILHYINPQLTMMLTLLLTVVCHSHISSSHHAIF